MREFDREQLLSTASNLQRRMVRRYLRVTARIGIGLAAVTVLSALVGCEVRRPAPATPRAAPSADEQLSKGDSPATGQLPGAGLTSEIPVVSERKTEAGPGPVALPPPLPAPEGFTIRPRGDRVDLYWEEPEGWRNREEWVFEIEIDEGDGFRHRAVSIVPGHSHFYRERPAQRARVRSIVAGSAGPLETSSWTVVSIPSPSEEVRDLIEEIQEASVRYFWNYRHPVSKLPREGVGGWNRNMCSIAASGMMFFNIAVGIERGWIGREEGIAHVRDALRFLVEKAERFHGVLPHWVHGESGKVIPFSDKDDGADLVEHAFVVAGALFFREYLGPDSSLAAHEIRRLTKQLWEETEWTWFVKRRPDGRVPLLWHWSPRHGFAIDLEIVGFNEAEIVYLLGLASPTYPIPIDCYLAGWLDPGYGHRRRHYGVELRLGREPMGPPLFFAHYTYLGVDPRALLFDGQSYFQHFADFCRVQEAWAADHLREYPRGIWGLTAGMGPDGYSVFKPGQSDGTVTPTAALSSMPYAPEAVRRCAALLYSHFAPKFWGPYGFRDGLNVRRNWFSDHYIAINVGPIAPMIENHRSGLGWKTLMRAPEMRRALLKVKTARGPVTADVEGESLSLEAEVAGASSPRIRQITSSSEQEGYLARYAMDGDRRTRWSSDFADDQWLQIDFEEPFPLAGLRILWETAFAEEYRVDVKSPDSGEWQTVYEVPLSDGGPDWLFFEPVRASALRIFCKRRGTGWGNSIWEIEFIIPDEAPVARATSAAQGSEAERAIDGRLETAWRPLSIEGEEFTLEWREPTELGGLDLVWLSPPPDYDVFIAGDGTGWSLISAQRNLRSSSQAIFFPPKRAKGLKLRFTGPAVPERKDPPALARVELKSGEERATPLRSYKSLARNLRPDLFPRWLNRQQEFWTTVGMPAEPSETLLSETGIVEPHKGAFSVQPFLWLNGKLRTASDAEVLVGLERGYLPLPWVRWRLPEAELEIAAVMFGEKGDRWTAVRYRFTHGTTNEARLGLAVRPVTLVPEWQHAGFVPLRHLAIRRNEEGGFALLQGEKPAMIFANHPIAAGVTAGLEREAAYFIERGEAPPAAGASSAEGFTSAVFWFDLTERGTVVALFPIDAFGRVPPNWLNDPAGAFAREWAEAAQSWRALLARPVIEIPEDALIRVMKSNLGYILTNKDGPWFKPGPRNYNHAWMRDGALTAAVVLRSGFTNEVRAFIEAFAAHVREDGWVPWMILESGAPVAFNDDLESGEGHEYDSQGQFAFVVREYVDFTGDEAFARALFPKVKAAMQFARALRERRMTEECRRNPEKRAYFGILPPSNSHEGYYPARHSYWDGFWLLRGLKDARALAERLGEKEDAEWLRAFEEDYRECHYASMRAVMEQAGLDTLPGCVELADFDPTSTSIALIYSEELPFLPQPQTSNTFKRFWQELEGRLKEGVRRQYTPYEVRNAEAFLRLGWRERALAALRFYLNDAVRPNGWNHMAEVVHHALRTPAYIGDMPHTWVGADYIKAVLALFAYEEGDRLVLAAGIDPVWLEEGVRVEGLSTRFGELNYTAGRVGSDLVVTVGGSARPPGGFHFELPRIPGIERIVVNGRTFPPDGSIRIDLLSESLPEGNGALRTRGLRADELTKSGGSKRNAVCDARHQQGVTIEQMPDVEGSVGPYREEAKNGLEMRGERDSYLLQRPLMSPAAVSVVRPVSGHDLQGSCSAWAYVTK